jgi:DNA polymerase III subunit alpha
MTNFIDLHCHSTYSTQDGMGSPKSVVERAVKLGWSAAAITEHGWMGSAFPFYKACREAGIKPILGCEMYVVPDEIFGIQSKDTRKGSFHLTVLALSFEGYQNLVAWNNVAFQRENFYYRPRISISAMLENAKWPLHHNVILSGCLGGELCSAILESNGSGLSAGAAYVEAMKIAFPNFYIEIQNHRIEKFLGVGYEAYEQLIRDEETSRRTLLKIANVTDTPIVLTNDSHLQSVKQRATHVAMRAQAWRQRDDRHYGESIETIAKKFLPDYAYFGNVMRSLEKIASGLSDDVASRALGSISEIVDEARISLEPVDNFSYSIPFSGYENTDKAIRRISKRRFNQLCKKHGAKSVRKRFEFELESMGDFAHYLLLMSDFIRAAKKQGILTNSRGSAANSLLCYCLEIHDIDPIEYSLVFTRFFNPARKKFPDIDIDVEKDRHEDFMRIVYEKMEELEGKGQVVPMCNLGTAANRAAFRMAASALGIEKEKQDEIAKLLPQMIDSGMVDEEQDAYEALKYDYPEIYELASTMFDSIKSVGQHACAYLFGTKDRPIEEWIPLYLISSSGSMVTQFDMNALDDFGLVKGDFLRLRTLSVIKRTLSLLGKSPLDLEQIPLDDSATYEMLREGRTEGIFTLQGKENRRGCIEVGVENIHDVIATVALYRPALTRTGMHTRYNKRKHGQERSDIPHKLAEPILGPTYGIPVFQEQVMEMGYAVGMSDEEVDEIYQAIKKAKGVGRHAAAAFEKIKPKFYKRAKKVMSREEADAYWKFIEGSQGYGFNKGHATSYGVLAVRSAYLKCHYPAEFFSALLDVYPERHRYIAAARSEGFNFVLPDINKSTAGFSYAKDMGALRVGLSRIKGLGPAAVGEIVKGQRFTSLDNFKARTTRRAVNAARIESLAAVGALEGLGIGATADDDAQFEILGFTIDKPKAFKGIKPAHCKRRLGEKWTHRGREKGVQLTEGRASVSKLFWIPKSSTCELKASNWAQVKAWLLLAVDENGIPFHIMANEEKSVDAKILKYLHHKCKGKVICVDGAIRQPFLNDGPMGYRFYGISGSYQDDPQIFGAKEKTLKVISAAHKMRRSQNATKA